MSSERDELARVMQGAAKAMCPITFAFRSGEPTEYGELFADAVLAAGYRKPRTITTAEELDALDVGSVILDRERDCWQKTGDDYWLSPETAGFSSNRLAKKYGPCVVIWEPTQ